MKSFDLEEERLGQEISKLGVKRVLLQLPEGLKPEAPRLARIVEQAGALPIISADPCYGACDLAVEEAELLGADLMVHFGHARLIKRARILTLYIEAKATVAVDKAVQLALPLLNDYASIGLVTTVQHSEKLDETKELLTEAGKKVLVGDSGQLAFPGQVIGCNYSNATSIADDVDAFLFVGGGLFHALGVALSTSKPTVIADPYDNRAFQVNDEAQKILKQRWATIRKAKDAEEFGILVSLKPVQNRFNDALRIKATAEEHGKAAYLLIAREITPEMLLEFPTIDAYVNTACPRISLDAPAKFSKPVLTSNEFTVVIGERSWESLLKKGLFEN